MSHFLINSRWGGGGRGKILKNSKNKKNMIVALFYGKKNENKGDNIVLKKRLKIFRNSSLYKIIFRRDAF